MSRTLIVLPGNADNVFLKNEIAFMKEFFDVIYVLAYDESKNKGYRKERGMEYIFVKNITLFSLVEALWNLATKKELRKEIVGNGFLAPKAVRRSAYAFLYESFYCNVKKAMHRKRMVGEVYLYSFWLSRGAYAAARYRDENKKGIKKVISRAHRYDLYEERNGLGYLPFRFYISDKLDGIYFISEHGKDYFLRKYGNGKCSYGISRLGTRNIGGLKKEVREKEHICIASCSSIIEVKRLDLLIKILGQLSIPYKWIHIGTGSLQENIKGLAEESLPRKSYRFLGEVENERILEVYQKWDVDYFINVSDSEGVPVSIMEAMSFGIPVVCRRVGGNGEIVNGRNGLLLPEKEEMIDVFEVENFFRQRLEQKEAYQRVSDSCIQSWDESYSAKKNYRQFYEGLIKKKRREN